jgi:trk system potassium uptake protein TrkA
MQILICGAGRVGRHIARVLAREGNEVTIVDREAALVERLAASADVTGIVGFASHPDVLERAGARNADLLIAATASDEVNIVACEMARALFSVPKRIARIRAQSYLAPVYADLFSRDHVAIDVVISPEIEVARAVTRRILVPGAFDMIPLVGDRLRLIGIRCLDQCPVINTPLRQLTGLFPDLALEVVAIERDGRSFIPDADDHMRAGDDVYAVADTRHVTRVLAAFGHEEAAHRRIAILGGGNIGLAVVQQLEREEVGIAIKLIEQDKARAEFVADSVASATVLQGDALDPDILEEANIGSCEAIVALTNNDQINVLGSLLAKRAGAKRSITLVNTRSFAALAPTLGIDTVVSPNEITVSTILQHVRRGRIRTVHALRGGIGEVVEAEALDTSSLVKKPIGEARLPDGVVVGGIVRGDQVIMPRADTRIRPQDSVVLFATRQAVKSVERLFSVRLEYF